MSSTAVSKMSSCLCPAWFAPLQIKAYPTQKIPSGWANAIVWKRNNAGELIRGLNGRPIEFTYALNDATGDLYGTNEPDGADRPHFIALKALGMLVVLTALPFYTVGLIAANCVKIGIDISSIFWRVIPQLLREIAKFRILSGLGNSVITVVWEIPMSILQSIWRIYRAPLYAIGMAFACVFTMVQPLEGRVWLGKIERQWHEGLPYQMDIRYGKGLLRNFFRQSIRAQIEQIAAGKILYLGYCMQKRGNMEDKVAGQPKFKLLKEKKWWGTP